MILILPGLRSSGPDHWQTHWEQQYPDKFIRVEQDNWQEPEKKAWVARLAEVVNLYDAEELVLLGHSVGCATILHGVQQWGWKLKGVMLVGPSDVDHPNYPNYIKNFGPMPLAQLPFPSVVVASDNDHVVSLQRSTYFASRWGSKLEIILGAGHFLPKDGFGPWPEGLALLQKSFF